ncbi:MAG: type I pullulanase [Clostridia bacterium]|nr:type I pullulanase [Clostridia bacterium]MBP3657373.1 type I pullulanase [Clostridia bacterium]
MNRTDKAAKALFDSAEFEREYHYGGPLGARIGGGATTFTLWAPTAEQVVLCLYDDGSIGAARERIVMRRGERGVYAHKAQGSLAGVYYDYEVTVGGAMRRTGDPYAWGCGVNGARSMVVDHALCSPEGWAQDRAPALQAENIIYELHVKDFTCDPHSGVRPELRGKYLALCEAGTTCGRAKYPTGLDYIRSLGVTHVQLMPVYDFGSVDEAGGAEQFNWGYDPVNYNVPEGSYATDAEHGEVRIRELKAAIAAMHRAGLRVIMDVVYNHTYSLDSALFKTVPWYFYRQNEDGSASNGSGCGNETASERSMCARYILDSVLYWAEEYHIDGFRFDLMGLHDVPLMNRIRAALDERYGKGEKILLGEPWCGGASAMKAGVHPADKGHLRELDPGVAAFCDATRDAVKGSVMDAASRGFVNGGGFSAGWLAKCAAGWAIPGERDGAAAPSQTVSYLSCHDDWTLFDKLVLSMDPKRRFRNAIPEVLRANRLAAAIVYCCQGHMFMLSGEEYGRTKLGVKNSYKSPLRINRFDWALAWERSSLADYYRGLIALRRQIPAFTDKREGAYKRILESADIAPGAAYVLMDNAGGSRYARVMLAVNTADAPAELALPQGGWDVLADGESSFLWQEPASVSGVTELAPCSAKILGLRA